MRMPLIPALEVLAGLRRDEIVVTTMGATREWPRLSQHPLDFHYLPSTMGGGPPLALGLALALPERHVIAFSGDGSLLMSLGSLVTIAASGAANLTLVLLDNGVYEVTGSQPTPAAAGGGKVVYAGLAAAAGFKTSAEFERLDEWQRHADEVLEAPGPRFISLIVDPVRKDYVPAALDPIGSRIERFREELSVES